VLMTGLTVFLGIALLLWKLPRRLMLKILHHDLMLDLAVSVVTLLIHWGSFSGIMAATVAGLITSLATSGFKRLIGSIHNNVYHPGVLNLKVKPLAQAVRSALRGKYRRYVCERTYFRRIGADAAAMLSSHPEEGEQ
jgi:nucleoside permease NupC